MLPVWYLEHNLPAWGACFSSSSPHLNNHHHLLTNWSSPKRGSQSIVFWARQCRVQFKGNSAEAVFKLCPVVHCQQRWHLNHLANRQLPNSALERRSPSWNRSMLSIFENYVAILRSLRFHSKRLASMWEPYLNQILLWWLQNGNFHNFIISSISTVHLSAKNFSLYSLGISMKIYRLLFNSVCYNPWWPFFLMFKLLRIRPNRHVLHFCDG